MTAYFVETLLVLIEERYGKQASKQASKQAGRQAGRQADMQVG